MYAHAEATRSAAAIPNRAWRSPVRGCPQRLCQGSSQVRLLLRPYTKQHTFTSAHLEPALHLFSRMFRRLTTSSQQPPPHNSGVSRSSTTPSRRSGANNPFNDQLANLSLDDPSAPPPPDYQTALRHSVGAYPASQGSSQAPTRQGSYAPPPGPPPPARQQTRPLSTPQPQQQYQQPTGPPPSTTQHQWQAPTPIPAPAPVPSQPPGRQASVSGGGLARRSSVEDPLASLGKYDLAVVVDDSPSMTELWDETRSALIGLVQQS